MSATIIGIHEAAKFLGKSPAALRNGYKRWGVPHFFIGGQIKFTQESLDKWVDAGVSATSETSAVSRASAQPSDRRLKKNRKAR